MTYPHMQVILSAIVNLHPPAAIFPRGHPGRRTA
jgi:hypothetical protein